MVAKRQVRAARKPGSSKKNKRFVPKYMGIFEKKEKKKSLKTKKKKSQPPELNKNE